MIALFGIGQVSMAQSVIDPITIGDVYSTQISGYTHLYYLPSSETRPVADKIGIPDDDSPFQWGLARLKVETTCIGTPLSAAYEIEAVDLSDADRNWLRQAYLNYKLNKDWSLSAGRIFLAAGYITPSPANIETVLYPRTPFNCYAYGVQTKGNFKDGFSLIADISGRSGLAFNDGDNFDGLEGSIRLSEKVATNLTLGITFQMSDEAATGAIDSEYQLGKLLLRGAVYSKCMKVCGDEVKGFYGYTGYEVFRRVEVHAQIDRQINADNIWTVGSRVWAPRDQVSLTVDYEMVENQHNDNRVIVRIEVRF